MKKIIITEAQANKYLKEAQTTWHFEERIVDRLNNLDLPKEDINFIYRKLDKLEATDFGNKTSYAIRLIKFKPNPSSSAYYKINGREYYKVIDNRGKDSTGDELWVIIRQNQLKTFFLRKGIQTKDPQRTKRILNVDEIIY